MRGYIDEVHRLAQYVIANVGVASIRTAKGGSGNGKRSGGIHALELSYLPLCYPDQKSRAIEVRDTINRALTSFIVDLADQVQAISRSYNHFPRAASGEYWAGNTERAYEDFFNQNIKPYLTEAQSNCQLMVALATQTSDLIASSRTFGYEGEFPAIKDVEDTVCDAYQNCITQTQDCCLKQTVGGEGPTDELKVALGQATYWDCTYLVDDINNAKKACYPPWSGQLQLLETRKLNTTNRLGATIDTKFLSEVVLTIVNADHLTVQVADGVIAVMNGTVKGYVTGSFASTNKTQYLPCECGECSDSISEVSVFASPISGNLGLDWCTDPQNDNCSTLHLIPAFTVDPASAPDLRRPSDVYTVNATSRVEDTCYTQYSRSHDSGTHPFVDTIGPTAVADKETGTATHVDGSYSTEYDEGDGTIHFIRVTWSFDKNTN